MISAYNSANSDKGFDPNRYEIGTLKQLISSKKTKKNIYASLITW